eukprot:TRINITY_DN8182_c0_g1_i1.p1 TRINITY_DN8182_c0_g1~~TRINITY_DN8182_c0_g1_i1.p1  ORF type:complete len:404 (-),score=74.75 TRINITY_DN8182_c0_g1_i1:52-1263(-)
MSVEEENPLRSDPQNQSIIMNILSQLRIGMDLSKVTLPTFILEPRSFLEKLTDYFTHVDLLILISKQPDPLERMIALLRWYVSGFYIKPKGVKKPYNPIQGEVFRCSWHHPDGTKTFYVAEQVSHHPPISSLYVSNRKHGLVINGTIKPRSKFLGNSAAAIIDGSASLFLLEHDEVYQVTFPDAYARGILFGELRMELVGNVEIHCAKTGLTAQLEFKAKPWFGGDYNVVAGRIHKNENVFYTLSGKWDTELTITDEKKQTKQVFWNPAKAERLPKIIPPIEKQDKWESIRLWTNVSEAIAKGDQIAATQEKTKLEDEQRQGFHARKLNNEQWKTKFFRKERNIDVYTYNLFNSKVYDPSIESEEEEINFLIFCKPKTKELPSSDAEHDTEQNLPDQTASNAS